MPKRRAGGDRREKVLEHVTHVIAARGFDRTRFLDVAAESGVAVSTLQSYFGSREDMLIEAIYSSTDREVQVLEELAAGVEDPWERLVVLLDRGGLAGDLPREPLRVLLEFWHVAASDRELRDHSVDLQRRYRQPFVDAISEGIASGAFVPTVDSSAVVTVLMAALDGLIVPHVLDHPWASEPGVRDSVLDVARQLLGATSPSTNPKRKDRKHG